MSVAATIKRIQAFSNRRDIPLNAFLIKDLRAGAVPHQVIPTATVSLSILLLCYKVFCSSKALGAVSDQSAKPVQALRNAGFVFESNGGPNRVIRENGVPGRRISGFEAQDNRRVAGLTLSKRDRDAFLAGKRDPWNGMRRDMEIDHRQPVEASVRAGEDYPELTAGMIEDGDDDLYYQALTKSSNLAKRGACQGCLNGEEIRVPAVGLEIERLSGQRYKRRFEDNLDHNAETGAPACAGCFYFNFSLRMDQDFFNR